MFYEPQSRTKAEFGFILNLPPLLFEQCPPPGKNMVMLINVASLKILQTVISNVEQGFSFFIKHTEIFWCHELES